MVCRRAHCPSPISSGPRGEAQRTYLEETLFEAVVTAGAVVALADGWADASERMELASFVDRICWLSTFTLTETTDAFDSQIHQLDMFGSVPEAALNRVRRVGDGLGASVVMCAAQQVARADGRLHPREETALELVRIALAPHPPAELESGNWSNTAQFFRAV